MPIKKSAAKELKKTKKRTMRNLELVKELKKAEKKILSLLANKDLEKLKEQAKNFISAIDKSVTKGIIHKNKAARKKSRLLKKIHLLLKGAKKS